MSVLSASAPGKVILSGEYAVIFGHRGIAMPSGLQVKATWEPGSVLDMQWTGLPPTHPAWMEYVTDILMRLHDGLLPTGTLHLENQLPLGKGMGSSTALVIALSKLFEATREDALAIENAVNPGNSGIDFAVIWDEKPVLFKKGEVPKHQEIPPAWLKHAHFIDTGAPEQTTKELVAWVKEREAELQEPLHEIGACTERLLAGETLQDVMPDHHRAQVALGVVTPETQELICMIEEHGGMAKVIGAGGRTGGSGTVLALCNKTKVIAEVVEKANMKLLA